MEDLFLWHLDFSEETNWLEAEYITWLIRLAEKKLNEKYRKILDIPCGVGRHHKYLRENGFEVFGIDINEKFIEIAKQRNKGYENYYEIKDMRKIDYKEEFDVILNWFTSFGYFSHEENLEVLKKFYNALRPKGILILETYVLFPTEDVSLIEHGDYIEIFTTRKLYGKTYSLDIKLYKKEGEDLKFTKELKVNLIEYLPKDFKQMFEKIGFKILFAFSNRSIRNIANLVDKLDKYELRNRRISRLAWVCYK